MHVKNEQKERENQGTRLAMIKEDYKPTWLTFTKVGFSLSLISLASPFTNVNVSSGMVKMTSIKMIPAERSKRCQSCTF